MKAMRVHYLLKRRTLRVVEARVRSLRVQMPQQVCPERAFVRRPLLHPTLRIRALIGLKEIKGLSCNFHDLFVWVACFSALLCKDHLSRRAELYCPSDSTASICATSTGQDPRINHKGTI
jgi:hypothetical protein